MIVFFGRGLIYWTGILTGIFFVFGFLGCRCFFDLNGAKFIRYFSRYHKLFFELAFFLFLIHGGLALLGSHFGVYV